MAEGGHAGAPPVRLWVRRVGVYCDEHRKTWLVAAEELGGFEDLLLKLVPGD